MMKFIQSLFIVAVFYSLCPLTTWAQKIEISNWPGGKIQSEGAYTADRNKVGKWKYYYANGQLEAEGIYTGKHVEKALEVMKRTKATAIDDSNETRDGEWVFYHDNGKMKGKVLYKDGCPQGKLDRWHENGKKAEESEFISCKAQGNRKIWDKEGVLYFENIVQTGGRTLEVEWYDNLKKKSEIPYRDGQQYGKVLRWYPNGQKEEEVSMRNTRVHGLYRSWYDNGVKKMEFTSINNIMSDEYREWYENGKIATEIIEMKDKKMISVKQYWDNGQLKLQGTSSLPDNLSIHNWSQSRQGTWTYWLKDGTTMKTENYNNGKLISTELAN